MSPLTRVGSTAFIAAACVAYSFCPALHAQEAGPYDALLLAETRALVHAVPGPLPVSIGYLSAQEDSGAAGDAVDGAPKSNVFSITPVFQVRYPHGWVMVDAAYPRDPKSKGSDFHEDRYQKILDALRGSGLIVITHEHIDHVGTLLKSPVADDVAPHTLLTRQQMETLLTKPKVAFTSLDSARRHRYLVVDYDRVLPIAPGVVLVRTPGHTPGAQMVYVKLASGKEILFAGDVTWLKLGVDQQRQKPDSVSRQLSEDRGRIAQQIAWLKNVVEPAGVAVAISHDGTQLQGLAKQGYLVDGLETGGK